MRSASLPLVLIFALLLAVPGLAAGDTLSDAAFLRSLAEMPLDLPPVGIPAPDPRACNISRPCGDGNNAACMGNASCVYSQRGVKCDGVETACPNYCEMGWYCSECSPPFPVVCWSLSGDCGVTNTGCNGTKLPLPGLRATSWRAEGAVRALAAEASTPNAQG